MAWVRSYGWLAGVAAATSLAGCSPAEAPAPQPEPAPNETTVPIAQPASVARAELLAAVASAADAFATGLAYPDSAAAMSGRRFALRLPFGCLGPDGGARVGYSFDADRETLKITARPEDWTKDQTVRELVGTDDTEAIEGFWITRPWITTAACPKGGAPGGLASPQSVALARVFEKGGSRLLRRGDRPYEVSRRGAAPEPGGLRLVLEGRIVPDSQGRAILCRSDGPDERPTCFVRVEFDRAAFEAPGGEMLAEWRS